MLIRYYHDLSTHAEMIKILSIAVIIVTCCKTSVVGQNTAPPVYTSKVFSIFPDRVEQGPFRASALSAAHLISNYESFGNDFLKPRIDFKFSINGKDNEMISGRDHHFNCLAVDGACETPLITFGEQLNDDRPVPPGVYLRPETKWTVTLDMRKVFDAFKARGYYETFNGNRIYEADFKGVYVAGGTVPLTWDFDNLQHFDNLQLHDVDGDHIYEVVLTLNSKEDKRRVRPQWTRSLDINAYPQHRSSYPVVDALYNMSLEEMIKAVEKDSTLRTGKEWAGVWTRDVSYSIILSMAILQPKSAQYSLMRKVKNGMIVQDTGTGGAYPVSTDRMIWAVAAWEVYKVTGERRWLETVYPIIRKSIESDLRNALDQGTGLMKGESSFLDWREQTYPEWMQPADIYQSLCLGTNAVHYQANRVLSFMAKALGEAEDAAAHEQVADDIKNAINENFWLSDRQYYAQYLYGRSHRIPSPRSEALGEALCVLFDIADTKRQREIVAHTPVNDYGIPCIYPQIPNIPPYHNDGIWPFVQSYWTMASAKAGNENAVLHSLAAIWRPAALFLTNKENFVGSTGDYAATQINSDNMLWSLSGNIAMIYKVLFGIQYNENTISFKPFVPEALKGKRTLSNFPYRAAILDIDLQGFGNEIRSVTLDGKPMRDAVLPASLKGRHRVRITLANNPVGGDVNLVPHYVSPVSPKLLSADSRLMWSRSPQVARYRVIRNGEAFKELADTTLLIADNRFAVYQVIAIDDEGHESFASEPLMINTAGCMTIVEAESCNSVSEKHHNGYGGDGYVRTDPVGRPSVKFRFNVDRDGSYAIDFRYANGNGPINTDNKCAIRTMKLNGQVQATVVLPQRGRGEWSDWGFSSSVIIDLEKGNHELSLDYEPHNVNMNVSTNEAAVDLVRIIRLTN